MAEENNVKSILLDILPAKALSLFTHLPAGPRLWLVGQVTNQALASAIAEGDMDFLQDKWLKLEITSPHCQFYFTLRGQRICVSEHAEADVTFAGPLPSLLQMASKAVDPDTLFFQRKLSISGDTELGLEIKNLLDSLELDSLPLWLNHPLTAYRHVLNNWQNEGEELKQA